MAKKLNNFHYNNDDQDLNVGKIYGNRHGHVHQRQHIDDNRSSSSSSRGTSSWNNKNKEKKKRR